MVWEIGQSSRALAGLCAAKESTAAKVGLLVAPGLKPRSA